MTNLISLSTPSLIEQMNRESSDFVLNGLRRGFVGFILASPDAGKSYLCLSIAYELATGIPIVGVTGKGHQQQKVLYWPIEDECPGAASRIIKHLDEVSPKNRKLIEMNVKLKDSVEPICVSSRMFSSPESSRASQQVAELIEEAKEFDLVIIDTIRTAMGSANEVEDDRMINLTLQKIAKDANVAVLVVHHPNKQVSKNLEKLTSVSASGLSYTSANSRMHLSLSDPEKEKGKKYLLHTKANFVEKAHRLNHEVQWSENSLLFINEKAYLHLCTDVITGIYDAHTQTETKQPKEKEERLEPLVIIPDDSLLSKESIEKAKKAEERPLFTSDMKAALMKHKAKKRGS